MHPSLAQFFELSIDMLCIADAEGFFRLVNPSFVQVLGWSPTRSGSTEPFRIM